MENLDIKKWIGTYVEAVKKAFSNRIIFIGLQGSYARNEQSEKSDIDVVLILDELGVNDIKLYDETISQLAHRELICGFLSGIDVLRNWEKSDLFQFVNDTIPIYGSLTEIEKLIKAEDISRAAKIGACNIYHMCVHNLLFEKSMDVLKGLLKSCFFVLKAKLYLEKNEYFRLNSDLASGCLGLDKSILELYLDEKSQEIEEVDIYEISEIILKWTTKLINEF